ncbi:MAG: hypothetical protein M1822_002535 [Bathelium mastoideum]|nr:MAG: hypothetical protein M1822_002535 [Bathelium mastoideum]
MVILADEDETAENNPDMPILRDTNEEDEVAHGDRDEIPHGDCDEIPHGDCDEIPHEDCEEDAKEGNIDGLNVRNNEGLVAGLLLLNSLTVRPVLPPELGVALLVLLLELIRLIEGLEVATLEETSELALLAPLPAEGLRMELADEPVVEPLEAEMEGLGELVDRRDDETLPDELDNGVVEEEDEPPMEELGTATLPEAWLVLEPDVFSNTP